MTIKTNKVEPLDFLFIFLMLKLLKKFAIIESTSRSITLTESFILATSFTLIWALFICRLNNRVNSLKAIAEVYISSILILKL